MELNDNVTSNQVNVSAFIEGDESGATAYAVSGAGSSSITVTQTSGNFQAGEQIIVNGRKQNLSRTIERVQSYDIDDVSKVSQSGNSFTANKKLVDKVPFGFTPTDSVRITTGGVVSLSLIHI